MDVFRKSKDSGAGRYAIQAGDSHVNVPQLFDTQMPCNYAKV